MQEVTSQTVCRREVCPASYRRVEKFKEKRLRWWAVEERLFRAALSAMTKLRGHKSPFFHAGSTSRLSRGSRARAPAPHGRC